MQVIYLFFVYQGLKDAMVFFVVLSLAAIYLALTGIFQHKVPVATGT